MQNHFNRKEKFAFRYFQQDEVTRMIKELPKDKDLSFKDILHLKSYSEWLIYTLKHLQKLLNDFVKSGNFPDILKYLDITPVF